MGIKNLNALIEGDGEPPRMVQAVDANGNLLYMATDESMKEWLTKQSETDNIRIYIPTHKVFATVWEFNHMYT